MTGGDTSTAAAALRLGVTVAELQAEALRRHPEAIALVGDGRQVSYAQLAGWIGQMVALFRSVGLRRGDGFSILATNRLEVIAANLAGQAMGMRYTPLHPKGSQDDHLHVLEHAGIAALLVDGPAFGERGKALMARVPLKAVFTLGADYGIDLAAEAARFSAEPVLPDCDPADISNIYYTGGTTGRPKGVAHRHGSVVAATMLALAHWDWPRDVRFLIATPISHAAGAMLTPTLMKGGSFHVLPGFDPEGFLHAIARERITATFMVPSMIYDLLDKTRLEDFDMSSLEMIIYGAAPIAPARLAEAIERIGPKFCQLYGQTEAPNTIGYLSRADHRDPALLGSCGFPLVPNQIRLMTAEGTEAAAGEAGEICLRGPLVMDGYWREPEETAKALAGGWLHTGDIARRDARGYLHIVDRVKDMVISGGFNIFTREVEDCLAAHPDVLAAAVIGVPHPRWGEAVVACVVARPGSSVDAEELIALVRDKKGPVQAPKQIEFVLALPLTAVGKVDKKALRARHWTGAERAVA